MASPYGHTLVGLTLLNLWFPRRSFNTRSRSLYGWIILGASLPDLDFIPGLILGQGGRFHHGISHSIGFALLAALLIGIGAVLVKNGERLIKVAGLAFCLILSHLILDYFTESPKGFPLFWPFTDTLFLSPLPILPRVERTWGHPRLWQQIGLCLLAESFFLIPLWLTRRRGDGANKS
jgi:inner membrane protein